MCITTIKNAEIMKEKAIKNQKKILKKEERIAKRLVNKLIKITMKKIKKASKKGKTKTSFWVYDYDIPKSCCPLPLKFREIVQDYFVSRGYEISSRLNCFGDIMIEINWSMDIKKEW